MKTETRSAIIVFAAIGIAILGVGVYFSSIQTETDVSFEPAFIDESGAVIIDRSKLTRAPDLRGISGYINTEPVTMADLKGKVVVVDFWTYTCINCIRTIPFLNAWYEKYSEHGLVILGVHSPEFEFEKDYNNVRAAVEKFGIKYPAVQDNEMATWNAYRNNYWPHKYIVDHEGYIRFNHIGEGAYEATEYVIQQLLRERNAAYGIASSFTDDTVSPQEAVDVDFTKIQTLELYLGYGFRVDIGNTEIFIPTQTATFSLPDTIAPNKVYLEGVWKSNRDNIELISDNGKVVLDYHARAVNIVATGNSLLTIKLDNESLSDSNKDTDVSDSRVRVSEERMYNLVFGDDYARHIIEIDIEGKGFKLYTFTFG